MAPPAGLLPWPPEHAPLLQLLPPALLRDITAGAAGRAAALVAAAARAALPQRQPEP
jgi:hypothetical protein